MRGPLSTGDALRIGGRPKTSGQAWTPARVAGCTFWLDPSASATLTLSGSNITAAHDRAGGSLVLTRQSLTSACTIDNTHKINGKPTIAQGGSATLYTTSGPKVGNDVPFAIYCVGQLNGTTTFPTFVGAGDFGHAVNQAIWLGARSGQWGGGCVSFDGHLGALGGTVDASAHVFSLTYDLSQFSLYVDGMLTGQGTGTFDAQASMIAGLGIAETEGGSDPANVGAAVWRLMLQAPETTATRWLHERYLGAWGGISLTDMIGGRGDSLTANSYDPTGTGDPTGSYLAQLAAQTGMGSWTYSVTNDGHPGETSAQILAHGVTSGLPHAVSGIRRNNFGIIWAGTNDLFSAVAPSTTLANIASMYSQMTALGCTTFVCTLFPWINWVDADLQTINAGIRASYPGRVLDLATIPQMNLGLSVSGGTWIGSYDGTYRIAAGAPGHYSRAGGAVIAAYVAPFLLALKR